MKRREQSQTEQLRKALAEREAQLQEAQARLAALEGSTSLQVGRALAGAARRPARGLVNLPRELYRLWRDSSSRSAGSTPKQRVRSPEPVRSYETERQEARLLAGRPAFKDERVVIAGVFSAVARAAVEPYARLVPLRPHDVQIVFDSADVDAVMVTASAAQPGNLWAHVGDPAAVDRTRALRWVLDAAAARGVATILVCDAPAPPALAGLGFDYVHQGDLGVPLHRYNPIAAPEDRAATLLRVSGAAPYCHPLVAESKGGVRADARWEELPELLRAAAVAVVDTPTLADQALACGTRALLAGTAPGPGLPDTAARTAADEADFIQAVAEGPLSPAELRLALRTLFLTRATPVVLADLLERVSLPAGGGSATQPLAGRATTVLACPFDDTESLALADDMFRQQHPPAEVVVPDSRAAFAGIQRLKDRGIPVRTVATAPEDRWSAAEWAQLAAAATTPWTALWDQPAGEFFLADALCAAECSGADAVGPAVDPAASGADYVFVSAVRPVLARRELVRKGLPPQQWSRHGARLLALSAAGPAASSPVPEHTPGG